MGGVLVAAVCAEGELQAGLLDSGDEVLVGDVGYFVDLDGDLFGAECLLRTGAEVDDFFDALCGPEALVFAGDG